MCFNDLKREGLLRTLWEKEKMLVTSIFSLPPPHNVFYLLQKNPRTGTLSNLSSEVALIVNNS